MARNRFATGRRLLAPAAAAVVAIAVLGLTAQPAAAADPAPPAVPAAAGPAQPATGHEHAGHRADRHPAAAAPSQPAVPPPAASGPAPSTPAPAEPAPAKPVPSEPAPARPVTSEPAPAKPTPAKPVGSPQAGSGMLSPAPAVAVPGLAASPTRLPFPPAGHSTAPQAPKAPFVVADSSPGPELIANLSSATVADHQTDQLTLAMVRSNTASADSGLGFTVTLPTGLLVASSDVTLTCAGSAVAAEGGSTITASSLVIAATFTSCSVSVSIMAPASGTYEITSSSVSALAGDLINTVTTQTLTVTPSAARLTAEFSPTSTAATQTATLSVTLTRTDTNLTGAQSSLSYTVTLPTDLVVATGSRTNGCGGTLTATTDSAAITLASGLLTATHSTCTVSVPVTASVSGSYVVGPGELDGLTGVVPFFDGCDGFASRVRPHTPPCGVTLTVTKLAQEITFPQPARAHLSAGTVSLSATSDSDLTVVFSGASSTSICVVSGTTVTLVGVGTCTVHADQSGDGTYSAATTVSRSFAITVPAQPPTGVTATAGVASITVSWSAPGDTTGITGYRAIAEPGPATCTTTTATSCVLGGTAGVTYTVTVIALSPDNGDSTAAGPTGDATPSAPPVSGTPPVTSLNLTTDQGPINTAVPGQHIVVIGTGFASYSTATIVIYSTPVVLGTVVTNSHGNFSKPVTIPPSLGAGHHTVIATGVDPSGRPHNLKLAVLVAGGGDDDDDLPRTGTDLAGLLLAGCVLTLTGAIARFGGARRRLPRRPA